jgi:hypothetical protein
LRLHSHNILNHSKWSTYDEDVNECYLVMGSVYPTYFPLHFTKMISKSLKLHSHNIFKSLKMKHIWWRYKWVLFGDGFSSLPYSFSFALQRWFLRDWSCTPMTFLNQSKWSTYDEDIKQCYLVMGSVYPTHFPLHFKDDF